MSRQRNEDRAGGLNGELVIDSELGVSGGTCRLDGLSYLTLRTSALATGTLGPTDKWSGGAPLDLRLDDGSLQVLERLLGCRAEKWPSWSMHGQAGGEGAGSFFYTVATRGDGYADDMFLRHDRRVRVRFHYSGFSTGVTSEQKSAP